MTQGNEGLLTPSDDNFHPGSDPWQTEGSWWSFFIPEARIGGWIYHLTRLNLGLASGGVWVWDDSTSSCFEAPYFLNHYHQILPQGHLDLNRFTWPDGVSLTTLEPLTRYRLTYADRDLIKLDLEYRAAADPFVTASGSPPVPFRLEQPCYVTGTLQLRGQTHHVDCIALRDHSWGIRREQTLSASTMPAMNAVDFVSRPVVYLFGNASKDDAFHVMGQDGYLVRDGHRTDLGPSTQTLERDKADGHITRIAIDAVDREGRALHAEGRTLSWILRPSNSGVAMVYLIEWRFNGVIGWGELQDVWPVDLWSSYRASARADSKSHISNSR